MEHALCTVDDNEWSAKEFINLEPNVFTLYKRNLKCLGCNGDAWFRRSSFGNKSPHFCAHHEEDCGYASAYSVIDQGAGEGILPATDPDGSLVINLGLDDQSSIETASSIPNPRDGAPPKVSGNIVSGKGVDFPAHHSLKNTLYQLVRSKGDFARKDRYVRLANANNLYLPTLDRDLFINFKEVNRGVDDGMPRIFWGFIADAGRSSEGTIWLNAGQRSDGLSIRIHPDLANDFLEYFDLESDLTSLAGTHALIIGPCIYAHSGKPVIWCSSLDYIMLRKYKINNEE